MFLLKPLYEKFQNLAGVNSLSFPSCLEMQMYSCFSPPQLSAKPNLPGSDPHNAGHQEQTTFANKCPEGTFQTQ